MWKCPSCGKGHPGKRPRIAVSHNSQRNKGIFFGYGLAIRFENIVSLVSDNIAFVFSFSFEFAGSHGWFDLEHCLNV
jgi:hypothetical protein